MIRPVSRFLGLLCLAGFIYLNVNYWQDPVFWPRWWDTVTHLEPDYLNFSPTVGFHSSTIRELPVADSASLSVEPDALRAAEAFAAKMDSFGLVVVHRGHVQTEWYAPGWSRDHLTQFQSMNKTVSALMMGQAIADGFVSAPGDAVSDYLAEWRNDPRGEITIENLLVMSSGLAQSRFTLNPFAPDSSFRFLFSRDRAPVVMSTKLEWAPCRVLWHLPGKSNHPAGLKPCTGDPADKAVEGHDRLESAHQYDFRVAVSVIQGKKRDTTWCPLLYSACQPYDVTHSPPWKPQPISRPPGSPS